MPSAQIPSGKTQITIQSKSDMKAKSRRICRGGGGGEARETPNLVLEVIVNEECARFLNAQGDAVQANTFEESRIRARSLKLELSCAHCESSGSRLRRRLILGLHRDSRHLFPFFLSFSLSLSLPVPTTPPGLLFLCSPTTSAPWRAREEKRRDGTRREKPESHKRRDSRVLLEPRTRTCIHGFAALPPYILWIGPQGWLRTLTCSIHGFTALPLYMLWIGPQAWLGKKIVKTQIYYRKSVGFKLWTVRCLHREFHQSMILFPYYCPFLSFLFFFLGGSFLGYKGPILGKFALYSPINEPIFGNFFSNVGSLILAKTSQTIIWVKIYWFLLHEKVLA
jgi:hypothetical protein